MHYCFLPDCANLEEELMAVASHQRETEEQATQQSTQIKNMLNQYNDIVSFYQSMHEVDGGRHIICCLKE